jgi:hypothetical protein
VHLYFRAGCLLAVSLDYFKLEMKEPQYFFAGYQLLIFQFALAELASFLSSFLSFASVLPCIAIGISLLFPFFLKSDSMM